MLETRLYLCLVLMFCVSILYLIGVGVLYIIADLASIPLLPLADLNAGILLLGLMSTDDPFL